MEALDLLFPVGIGLLFAAVHYFSGMLHALAGKMARGLRAALAGVTAAYLFLQLYPQTILANDAAGYGLAQVFLFIGGGFAAMFLLEQLGKSERIHPALFALIHLAVGMLLMVFFSFNALQGWLFLAWALLMSTITHCSLGSADASAKPAIRAAFAATTLLGILATAFLPIPLGWLLLLQAIITGAFTYLTAREMLPTPGQAKPWLFLVGLVIASAIILFL